MTTRQVLIRALFSAALIMVVGVRFERTYVALACSAAILLAFGLMHHE